MPNPIAPIAGAAAAAAMFAPPAMAETAAVPHVRVELNDLDLRRDADVARLQQRIKSATRVVCGRPSPRTLNLNAGIVRCQLDAFNGASSRVETIVAAVRAGKDQRLAVSESMRTAVR